MALTRKSSKEHIKLDMEELCDIMEFAKAELPRLTLSERIDMAARIHAAVKTACEIVDKVKADVKEARNHKSGDVPGEIFKAALSVFVTTRLDQKALKEAHPVIYDTFVVEQTQESVSFKAR